MTHPLALRARLFIWAVVVAGLAAAAANLPEAARWTKGDALAALALAAGILLTEQFTIKFRYGTETWNLSLTEALLATGLLLARPSVLTLAVGAGVLAGHIIRRLAAHKVAFNVGQFVLGVAVAEAIRGLVPAAPADDPLAWGITVVSLSGFFLVNATSIALIISIVESKPFGVVLLRSLGLNLVHWAGNVAIGVLAAVVVTTTPYAGPLLLVPLILSYSAYRAWLEGIRERERMQELYEASRGLIAPLSNSDDFRPFLGPVARMLEASVAEVVLIEDGQAVFHGSDGTRSTLRMEDGSVPWPEAYVRLRDGVSPQIAVIGTADQARGALAVYREEPLSKAERSLLEAVASQIAIRTDNVKLFYDALEQRTQLEEIIASTSDGIMAVSPAGRIMAWNPAMERITGFPEAETVGLDWAQVMGADEQGLPPPWALPAETAEPGMPGAHVDRRLVRRDRAPRWVRYASNPIRDREGIKGFVVVTRDVTAELEAEQLKNDFVATVSHELRTPLTPLKGFLTVLIQGTVEDSSATRAEYYGIMLKQTNRLERLITDLLEVSRVEAVTEAVASQTIEVTSVVAEYVQEFRGGHLDRRIELGTPGIPLFVRADPFRLGQVLSNLLSNAVKYSPRETAIEVLLEAAATEVQVSVRDRGEGIPSSELQRVFERFHRVEQGLVRNTGGTGLGLYIAKRLVQAMGGRIWVESEPGSGSTFIFTLPRVESGGELTAVA